MAWGKSKRYSLKEKRAYDAGRAYAKAQQGKRMGLRTEAERRSFANGYRNEKGGRR